MDAILLSPSVMSVSLLMGLTCRAVLRRRVGGFDDEVDDVLQQVDVINSIMMDCCKTTDFHNDIRWLTTTFDG